MNERENPCLPNVTYEGDMGNSELPFTFEINRERLAKLLVDHLGLSAEQVRNLVFKVSAKLITSIDIEPTHDGVRIEQKELVGHVPASKDKRGIKEVGIFTTPMANQYHDRKNGLLEFSFLAKQDDLPPTLQGQVLRLEKTITGDFATKRLPAYLRTVSRQRAAKFMDYLLQRKFHRELVGVILHESRRVVDKEELEKIQKRIRTKRRISTTAGITASIAGGLAIGTFIVDNQLDLYRFIEGGTATIFFGIGWMFSRKLEREEKLAKELASTIEDKAKKMASPKNVTLWIDLVELQPNPNYQVDD
jgi:hypothetical protein